MKTTKTPLILALFTFATILFAQEMPLVYSVENTGADCPPPPLPSFTELPHINYLPDPFRWADGRGRISSKADWRCRRNEIAIQLQHYELGYKPSRPDTMYATFADTMIYITIIKNGDTLVMLVPIKIPEGDGPFPAVIGVGFTPTGSLPSSIFTSRKIATIHYREWQIANAWSNTRGDGLFYKLYPDKRVGKFTAFAWGASRIIDALEMLPQTKIDLKRIAITGCSYAGKIALFSAALDERIALAIVQESGGGGDAAWRVTERLSGSRETLRNAQGFAWYHQYLSLFNDAVTKLPFDHHEVLALIAPRALLVLGNPDYEWLAEESGHISCMAAREVWKALGVPERFGFSKVGGHQHCLLPQSQYPEVEAFVEKFLLGNQEANTNVIRSPFNYDLTKWITWETPTLADASSCDPEEILITDFVLNQNYPNPFNPETVITYILHKENFVSLDVYDLQGKHITNLANGKQKPGFYSFKFDGKDLPSGIYIITLNVGNGRYSASKQITLLK